MGRRSAEHRWRARHRRGATAVLVLLVLATAALRPEVVAQGAESAGDTAAGRDVFASHCAVCHGRSAQGRGAAPSLLGVEGRYTLQEIEAIVRQGRAGMPSFDATLSDAEVDDVVAFLASLSDDEAAQDQQRRRDRWWDGMMPHGAGAGFMVGWLVLGLLLLAVAVTGVAWLVRRSPHDRRAGDHDGPDTAEPSGGSAREELDRRYARGELSHEEYRRIRDELEP